MSGIDPTYPNIKLITVRIFPPKPARGSTVRFHAPNGKVWIKEVEDNLLKGLAEQVEKHYPGVDFKLVEVNSSKHSRQFNFVSVTESAR